MSWIHGAVDCCECSSCTCHDCITGDEVDSEACCHSFECWDEMLVLKINRSAYSVTTAGVPAGGPCECEIHSRRNYSAMKPIQAIYEPHSVFFYCDTSWRKVFGAAYCNSTCDPSHTATRCCDPVGEPSHRANCRCTQSVGYLSPYQYENMADSDYYMPTLDILCYNAGIDSVGPGVGTTGGACGYTCDLSTGTGNHLAEHMLAWVHREHWWKASDDCGDDSISPDPLYAPNCCATCTCTDEVNKSCIVPEFWIHACSGAPLFDFQVIDAADRGVITSTECQNLINALKNPSGCGIPLQSTLEKLWEDGILKVKDWRGEQNTAYDELTDVQTDLYAWSSCHDSDAGDLPILGPCAVGPRVMFDSSGSIIHTIDPDQASSASGSESAASTLQAACVHDPWSGGPYPVSGDADYDYFVKWNQSEKLYTRAQPGGWTWVCWDISTTDAPQIARAYSGTCANNSCMNASGYPRDYTDTDLECVNPGGCSPAPPCNPSECTGIIDVACEVAAGKVGSCSGTSLHGYCRGLHLIHFEYKTDGPPGDRYVTCGWTNHAYLQTLNSKCADWDQDQPYQCRNSWDDYNAWSDWPRESGTHYAAPVMCISPHTDSVLCCGGMCPTNNSTAYSECLTASSSADLCDPDMHYPVAYSGQESCLDGRGSCCISGTCHDYYDAKQCAGLGGTFREGEPCCNSDQGITSNCTTC